MKRLQLHSACKLFPELPEDELQQLAADIKANGLRNPVVLLGEKILDGRNRYAACKLAGVKPRFETWDGQGSPVEWVISQNLVRRHLSTSQRAVVAHDLLPLLEKEAKERQRMSRGRGKKVAQSCATFSSSNGKASEAAARLTKTNARYVEMVKEISRSVPKLLDRIRVGSMTVAEAQRIAASEVRRNGHHRKPGKTNTSDAERVFCGNCMKLIPRLDNGSVNLVLCSPPYAEQRRSHYQGVSEAAYAKWTVRWMGLLREKLADDGSALIVIRPHLKQGVLSDYVLRTRLALREDGWSENEELIWLKPDAPPLGSTKRPRRTWESILWFSKTANPYCNLTACGRESTRIGFLPSLRFGIGGASIYNGQKVELRKGKARCCDVFVASVGAIEGIEHPAMFPVALAEQLISTFSQKGDLVLDPFCGSGSTLVAAKKLGRDFRGFDSNRKYIKIALGRLAATKCGTAVTGSACPRTVSVESLENVQIGVW